MRLVLASNNPRKLRELDALFAPLGVELVSQLALGISEAEEPHVTFVENALAKARHAARHAGGAAMADDSGVCVDALGGAPGVASAVWCPVALPPGDREAQRNAQDAANNALMIERLPGLAGTFDSHGGNGSDSDSDSDSDSTRARYVCTLVALRTADDPEPLVAVGRWEGRITVPAGQHGFGYDPLMFIPAFGATVAELSADVKNAHSHRAIAARQMCALMREVWRIG